MLIVVHFRDEDTQELYDFITAGESTAIGCWSVPKDFFMEGESLTFISVEPFGNWIETLLNMACDQDFSKGIATQYIVDRIFSETTAIEISTLLYRIGKIFIKKSVIAEKAAKISKKNKKSNKKES